MHTQIRTARAFSLGIAIAAVVCGSVQAQVSKYDLHLVPDKFNLYTDPYNGKQIHVGGFSGLYPTERPGEYYVVTDRGPAPDAIVGGTTYKTWATPSFGPHILRVRLEPSGKAKIEEIIPLRRPNGTVITGLPTSVPATDIPYDFFLNRLPFDEDSIDAEGITIDPWGNFWVCEEYKPSVAMISRDGVVQMRLVPAGTLTGTEQVPTYDLLPGVLAKRRNNRGLEGIAAAPDGTLYAIMQRPLNNPNRAAADANGNARLVAINLHTLLHQGTAPLVRQYIYNVPPANGSVTLSDVFSIGGTRLLIPERNTDKIFLVDVASATDITPLESADGKLIADPTKTVEQLNAAALAAAGIVPVSKTAIVHALTSIDPFLEKVEGICVVGGSIVLLHDNDFNVAEAVSAAPNPVPGGPIVQLELLTNNFPRFYVLPLP